jgi:hypothetical protein
VSSPTTAEGGNLDFIISLSNPSATDVLFTPVLSNLTATVGVDTDTPVEYSTDGGNTWTVWTSGGVTIPAGTSSVIFRVPTLNDNLDEITETLQLTANVTSSNTFNNTASGTGTITDNDLLISGNVFHDTSNNGTVDGTGTNAAGLYVNLVNLITQQVIASVPVNADGTYQIHTDNYPALSANTTYSLMLTPTLQTVGSALTVAALPNGWISTGENLGSGAGTDGLVDGRLVVTTGSELGVTSANFGIRKVPDVTPVITVLPNVMQGVTNFSLTVRVTELNQQVTEGVITVLIPKDTRWSVGGAGFNTTATAIGGVTVHNSSWSYNGSDPTYHIFTTTNGTSITSGGFLTFGFDAVWNAGQTKGVYTITSQITSGSGGEVRIDNNVDAEKIDYFIF